MIVYRVELKASFYVLAGSREEAEKIADLEHPIHNMELPIESYPAYSAYWVRAQDDYHRRKCINFESNPEGSPK